MRGCLIADTVHLFRVNPWLLELDSGSYGFSSGHVWMWELNCEEGWVPKSWFFWTVMLCRSPTPVTRDSTRRGEGCWQWDSLSFFYGLPAYSKFKSLFYTFTKTLGQRFDILSSPSPRFIISINHCCSSNRVPAAVILWESALSSIIYLLYCVL